MCWLIVLDYRIGKLCMYIMWYLIIKEFSDFLKFTIILMVYIGLGYWK